LLQLNCNADARATYKKETHTFRELDVIVEPPVRGGYNQFAGWGNFYVREASTRTAAPGWNTNIQPLR
jgi:hypothetical protein